MLSGLSPKQNREVPPLNYDIVYQVKRAFPDATIVINGGIANAGDCRGHLDHVDGVMLGRAAYQTPYVLCGIDTDLYCSEQNRRSRREVVEAYVDYMSRQFASGVPVHAMSRHILGLFHGQAGARTWRRYISERAHRDDATPEIVLRALGHVMGCDDRSAA